METKTYRDLAVWQRAMDLVEAVYKLSEQFPDKEKFGLTSQMQRAAVSVPANIAEATAACIVGITYTTYPSRAAR